MVKKNNSIKLSIMYGTAQMQRRTLASKSIASAQIITDWGAWHSFRSRVLISFLVGWILASETSATPLWSAIAKAFAFCEREQVWRYIWAVPYTVHDLVTTDKYLLILKYHMCVIVWNVLKYFDPKKQYVTCAETVIIWKLKWPCVLNYTYLF